MSKQLTREEAISEYMEAFHCDQSPAERIVDFLVAIGAFTPAEPKTVEHEVEEHLRQRNWSIPRPTLDAFWADLAATGFKIVKA